MFTCFYGCFYTSAPASDGSVYIFGCLSTCLILASQYLHEAWLSYYCSACKFHLFPSCLIDLSTQLKETVRSGENIYHEMKHPFRLEPNSLFWAIWFLTCQAVSVPLEGSVLLWPLEEAQLGVSAGIPATWMDGCNNVACLCGHTVCQLHSVLWPDSLVINYGCLTCVTCILVCFRFCFVDAESSPFQLTRTIWTVQNS